MPYVTSVERHGIGKGLRESIAMALAEKFGAAGKRLMGRVRDIRDLDELRGLFKAVLSAETIQEIRALLTSRKE